MTDPSQSASEPEQPGIGTGSPKPRARTASGDADSRVRRYRRMAWATLPWLALLAVITATVHIYEVVEGRGAHPRFATTNGLLEEADLAAAILYFSSAVALGLAAYALSARFGRSPRAGAPSSWSRRVLIGILLVGSSASGFNYFYARRGLTRDIYPHTWDSFHYLLGAKYYDEIDYTDLYHCALRAVPDDKVPEGKSRDLKTNSRRRASKIRAESNCQSLFSPERWQEFRGDVATYAQMTSWKFIGRIVTDRGYNGTPTHSAVAEQIAHVSDLNRPSIVYFTLIDVALVSIMVGLATWAFGVPGGLLFALLVFVNGTDRMSTTGQSFFRYGWFASAGLGLIFLGMRRYVAGAVFLATSAMLNVFPVVFCIGGALPLAWRSVENRRPTRAFIRYASAGCLAATLCFAWGASTARGLKNYSSFIANMETHNVAERFPGYGVGLKFLMIDSGPADPKQRRVPEKRRLERFERLEWLYHLLAWPSVALAAWLSRRMPAMEAAVLFGVTTFFCLLGTTGYYFAAGSFLGLLYVRKIHRTSHQLMFASLFALNTVSLWGWSQSYHRFYNYNVLYSWSLALALVSAMLFAAYEQGYLQPLRRWIPRKFRAPAARAEDL